MNPKSSIPNSLGFKSVFLLLALVLVTSVAVFVGVTFANAQDATNESTTDEATSQDADLSASTSRRVEMYRIYNPWTGEHLYTSKVSERDSNVKLGWKDEGIEWVAPIKSNIKVYRLYNPYVLGGDHHYTTNETEYNNLAKQGWKKEGIAWYGADSKEAGTVKLLRQYNPFASTGTHNYTKDEKEQANLVKAGWKAEGVGWYGYSTLKVDVSKLTAKVSTVGTTYTGKQLTPTISIAGLTAGKDYTVTYGKNINAGKNAGTATIKGKGECTGTLTVKFEIKKATPTFTLPKNLTGVQNNKLSTVKIPAATNGTFAWKSGTASMSKQGTQQFDATFTPKDTKNYNTVATKVSVYVKGLYSVTFDTGDGSKVQTEKVVEGEKATLPTAPTLEGYGFSGWYKDSACSEGNEFNFDQASITGNTKLYAKWLAQVSFDTQGHGSDVEARTVDNNKKVADPSTDAGTSEGLEIEGWYKDAKCSTDQKWNFSESTTDKPVKLYANWKPSDNGDKKKYWLGYSKTITSTDADTEANVANENYVAADCNVIKSSAEIDDDIDSIAKEAEDGTANNEGSVTNEWKEYMNSDKYHLYATWNGSTADSFGESDENKFVEFRIIEVGSHNADVEGENVVTFQATHSLPEGTNMSDNSTASQKGWENAVLKSQLNDTAVDGSILANFSDGFVSRLQGLTKYSAAKSSETTGVVNDMLKSENNRLWVLSEYEYNNESKRFTENSTPYAYYSALGTASTKKYNVNSLNSRAGNKVKGYAQTSQTKNWSNGAWTRTPSGFLMSSETWQGWAVVTNSNFIGSQGGATLIKMGVIPAFSFSAKHKVTFDNQGHGNSVNEQTLDYDTKTATEPSATDVGTADGLELEGWYTDAKCSKANRFEFTTEVTKSMKLYANWVPADNGDKKKYWLGYSKTKTSTDSSSEANVTNENYVAADQNVIKSSAEIDKDIKAIRQEASDNTADQEGSVTNKWKEYMNSDKYHLYTTWNGSTADSVGENAENGFVEFRIIEVGAHNKDVEGDNIVTFQATHSLPAASIIATQPSGYSSELGWENSKLKSYLNDTKVEGSILANFSDSFVSSLQSLTKYSQVKSTTEGAENDMLKSPNNKMWILSEYEYDYASYRFTENSKPYAYYTAVSSTVSKQFNANSVLSRAGNKSKNYAQAMQSYTSAWTRSADGFIQSYDSWYGWGVLADVGYIGSQAGTGTNLLGVIPCFSM
jgi:uncharacterized repeat protein (TIGR02543 family)